MGKQSRNIDRDKMAVELYFSVFKYQRAIGIPYKEAKDIAYDAVELRYNISQKRLQNIMYENHETLTCNKELFVEDNAKLLEILKDSNYVMQECIEENNKLIRILEICCNV
jgi:hypothetical protein